MKAERKTIIEFTPNGYTMSKADKELLAGAIMSDEVQVVCTEFCSADKSINLIVTGVWIHADFKENTQFREKDN